MNQKPMEYHVEAVGHKEAFEFVRELIKNNVAMNGRA
jgi:hypothetical protein